MNQDFVDLLRAFAAADVRFLIVGAYALAWRRPHQRRPHHPTRTIVGGRPDLLEVIGA